MPDEVVDVLAAERPKSIQFIKKKMDKEKITSEEMHDIIADIVDGNLTDVELTAFVTASYIYGMDADEIEWMTRAMVKTGDQVSFDVHPVMDHHSIGGVPGNKISLCVVPIVAAAGLSDSEDQQPGHHGRRRQRRPDGDPGAGQLQRRRRQKDDHQGGRLPGVGRRHEHRPGRR